MYRKKQVCLFPLFLILLILSGCSQSNASMSTEEPVITVSSTDTFSLVEENTEAYTDTDSTSETTISNDVLPDETVVADSVSETSVSEHPTITDSEPSDWVSSLAVAQTCSQLVTVAATGNTAVVSLHTKDSAGVWTEVLSTNAQIGKNGIGKTREGDGKTPRGSYHFTFAFGRLENPNCALSYTQVDDSFYWVDDSNSSYYNKFVSTADTIPDWNSAENIMAAGSSYNYVLATDYNSACIPEVGSAIFVHCQPTGGAGCIAIPEKSMKQLLQLVQSDCTLIIDSAEELLNY